MNVEQILQIFYLWPVFELVAFFLEHTLGAPRLKPIGAQKQRGLTYRQTHQNINVDVTCPTDLSRIFIKCKANHQEHKGFSLR